MKRRSFLGSLFCSVAAIPAIAKQMELDVAKEIPVLPLDANRKLVGSVTSGNSCQVDNEEGIWCGASLGSCSAGEGFIMKQTSAKGLRFK